MTELGRTFFFDKDSRSDVLIAERGRGSLALFFFLLDEEDDEANEESEPPEEDFRIPLFIASLNTLDGISNRSFNIEIRSSRSSRKDASFVRLLPKR
mmetsp:Transcript_9603/g.13606  ORF Transcript_9603/g.13606 Transcript_9603/m.13606 type:complete len:97 (+) Transcript_9603:579-869(+)